jgi:regulator of replication initiation timing
MNIQRDELLENFIKSQKLALSRLVANHAAGKRKAMNRWKQEVFEQRRQEFNENIRLGVETIAAVKEQAKRTEAENEQLAKENDELRRFSMDGFVIARNVQQLSDDREKLSVDLADKTEQIKELLIQNRKLRDALAKLGFEPDEEVHTKSRVKAARIKS